MLRQKIIMNKEILYEILNSKSEILSSTEIENIMNEELDKSPQDMDTDLIDLCLDALNTFDEEKLNKRKKKYRFGKTLIAAAIFVLVIGITIPVCAKYLSINVPEGIVAIYNECFNIDISQDDYIDDIYGQLEQDGIDDIVLPKLIFETDSIISNYTFSNDNNALIVSFDFSNDAIIGSVTIEKYEQYEFFSGTGKISSEFENIEYFNINDISVLVFGIDDKSYISYSVDKTDYCISLNCDYKTACQIAKTI
jgi:hypothetical protein